MFVKPATGLRIRDPIRKDYLPEEGREVDATDLYWHRLKTDGDIVEASPVETPESPT